jgi:hypothetical protein
MRAILQIRSRGSPIPCLIGPVFNVEVITPVAWDSDPGA